MRDFEVYWTAGTRAAAAQPLYRAEDGHYQFKYLPAFAVAAIPLSWLSLSTAKFAWFLSSVALLIALLALTLKLLPQRRRTNGLLLIVVIIAMAKFYGHELVLGQVNILFVVLVVAALLAVRGRRTTVAALLLVASFVVKPYGILLLAWLAVVGGVRTAAVAVVGIAMALALAVPLYGFEGTLALHRTWWTTVTQSTAPNLTNPDNVSVAAFAAKWLGDASSVPAIIFSVLLVVVAAIVVIKGAGVEHREALDGALLLTLVPLLSPQGWDYVFLVATPAIALIVNYDDHLPALLRMLAWIAIAAIGLSIYDILGRQLYARFMELSIITPCFFVVIAALAVLRQRRIA